MNGSWHLPPALCTVDDASFPGDRQTFVTMTCGGRGNAVWGCGHVARKERMNTDRRGDRSSAGYIHSAHMLCLSVLILLSTKHNHLTGTCCLQLCVSGNKIWRQFVYLTVCVCVCEEHIDVAQKKQNCRSVTECTFAHSICFLYLWNYFPSLDYIDED